MSDGETSIYRLVRVTKKPCTRENGSDSHVKERQKIQHIALGLLKKNRNKNTKLRFFILLYYYFFIIFFFQLRVVHT